MAKALSETSCAFCKIISSSKLPIRKSVSDRNPKNESNTENIVAEDEKLLLKTDRVAVFQDIHPAATHHYLVCPSEHIKGVKFLNTSHLDLVKEMVEAGFQVLKERGGNTSNVRMGFHWPPMVLVSHLHLHVISPPEEISWLRSALFSNSAPWFGTSDYVIKKLTSEIKNS